MNKIIAVINNTFSELEQVLTQLTPLQYKTPIINLSKSTIGMHVRHIVEMFQCLIENYETGKVNYDLRKRDYVLETDINATLTYIRYLMQNLNKPDRTLDIEVALGTDNLIAAIPTNYTRELLYNLEHCIHHLALIKVGLLEITTIQVSEKFGVAPSTIQYRSQCVQ